MTDQPIDPRTGRPVGEPDPASVERFPGQGPPDEPTSPPERERAFADQDADSAAPEPERPEGLPTPTYQDWVLPELPSNSERSDQTGTGPRGLDSNTLGYPTSPVLRVRYYGGAGERLEPSTDQAHDDDSWEAWEGESHPEPEDSAARWRWPVILFGLTILSTIWVGVSGWSPISVLEACLNEQSWMPLRQAILANWQSGFLYSLFLLGILMAHELGHYLVARWYRVPATPPIFLPFPINSIGTLGAVIAMRGHEADRKQIFDIGIAGPLAGLVVAFPIALLGTWQLDLALPAGGGIGFEIPLALRWMIRWFHPEYADQVVWLSQLNPAFTAAWVALLVTGLNMMPVSQLDGGHVTYGLFVQRAHWISCALLIFAIAYMVYQQIMIMALMVVLLLLMGPTHPPTRDDSVTLGWPRFGLGLVSLLIPILCFPPNVFKFNF